MFCYDAIFDGERLSDHGLMICNFDGGQFSTSGGDVTFVTSKPPSSNRFAFHASKFEDPIKFNFSVGKNVCDASSNDDMYLSQDEESDIMRFLQRVDGYHWLSFIEDGWEDVFFNCYINPQPHYIKGRVIGYDLEVITDSPYGYSQLHEKEFTLKPYSKKRIVNYSDIPGEIHPRVKITTGDNHKSYTYRNITMALNKIDDITYIVCVGFDCSEMVADELSSIDSYDEIDANIKFKDGTLLKLNITDIKIKKQYSGNYSCQIDIEKIKDDPAYSQSSELQLEYDAKFFVKLKSGNDDYYKITEIIPSNKEIILDEDNDLIDGVEDLNNFNFEFPIMVNTSKDLYTYFDNQGNTDLNIKLEYRFVRRVAI